MSVSGGWLGLPAKPLRPLNVRPRMVSVGLMENRRVIVSSLVERQWVWHPRARRLAPGSRIVTEQPVHSTGDGLRPGRLDAAQRHAEVLSGIVTTLDSGLEAVLEPHPGTAAWPRGLLLIADDHG